LVPLRGFFKQLLSTTTSTHPTKELLQYSVSVHLPGLPTGSFDFAWFAVSSRLPALGGSLLYGTGG
jgi:hypothetical protein